MKVGELVVLVSDVQGVAAGKVGRLMSVREDAVLVECGVSPTKVRKVPQDSCQLPGR